MRKIFNPLIILFFFPMVFATAQEPNWTVQENDFEHTMTLIASLSVDKVALTSVNDKLAAFVGNELRGVANLIHIESENAYFAYITIFGNNNSETINFKIYDSTNNTVIDITKTLDFKISEHYGSLIQPYSVASTELSSNAEITNVYSEDVQVIDYVQKGDTITLEVLNSGTTKPLTLEFEISSGSEIRYNDEVFISGVTKLNLKDAPFEFKIISEDKSVLKTITINVNIIEVTQPRFFRKHEVCHTLGAIRVIHYLDGTETILVQDGKTLSSLQISNGQVVFNNLQAGLYKVRIGEVVKEITINYKE